MGLSTSNDRIFLKENVSNWFSNTVLSRWNCQSPPKAWSYFMTGYLLCLMKCSHLRDILTLSSLPDHIKLATLHHFICLSFQPVISSCSSKQGLWLQRISNASTSKFIIGGSKVLVKNLNRMDVILDGPSKLLICNGSLRNIIL